MVLLERIEEKMIGYIELKTTKKFKPERNWVGIPIPRMIAGDWIVGAELDNPGPKFIEQLATLMVDLHSYTNQPHFPLDRLYDIPESNMEEVIHGLIEWPDRGSFCEDALYDLLDIKPDLDKKFYIHGDLWKQNILVDEEGNLNGLRDWESFSYGDPHWDFRMIRRWIGWDGLDKLLKIYNKATTRILANNHGVPWTCKREYIEILDKISLCHSIKIRKERGLLRHDKPDTLDLFKEYIRIWPKAPLMTVDGRFSYIKLN